MGRLDPIRRPQSGFRFGATVGITSLFLVACTSTSAGQLVRPKAHLLSSTVPATGGPSGPSTQNASVAAVVASTALLLHQLPSIRSGSLRGYVRTQRFGEAWVDVDQDGCSTRDQVLRRDLTDVSPATGCDVEGGVLDDPYTDKSIPVTPANISQIQIDHVVALGLAWQLGARSWSEGKRVAFANDPANLLAVDAHSNESKGDDGPDAWLPPATDYRCTYVVRFTRVAALYRLAITRTIRSAIKQQLATCTEVVGDPTQLKALPHRYWPLASTFVPQPAKPNTAGGAPYYPNCAAVEAAGKAPIHRGEPGYSRQLDRDGDGVACET